MGTKKKNNPGGCGCCGDPCDSEANIAGVRITISGSDSCTDSCTVGTGNDTCVRDYSPSDGTYEYAFTSDPVEHTYYEELWATCANDVSPGTCEYKGVFRICLKIYCITKDGDSLVECQGWALNGQVRDSYVSSDWDTDCDGRSSVSGSDRGWELQSDGTIDATGSGITSSSYDAGTDKFTLTMYHGSGCCKTVSAFPSNYCNLESGSVWGETYTVEVEFYS